MRRFIYLWLGGWAIALAMTVVWAFPAWASTPEKRTDQAAVATQLQLYPAPPAPLGKPITITALLTDYNGIPLSNMNVAFLVDSNYQFQGRTDPSGKASGTIPAASLPGGKHMVKAVFLGMNAYQPSSGLQYIEVLPAELTIRTVPALAGVHFQVDGKDFFSNTDGVARVQIEEAGDYTLSVLPFNNPNPNFRVVFNRWLDDAYTPGRQIQIPRDAAFEVGLQVSYQVGMKFIDLQNRQVDLSRIGPVTLKNSQGTTYMLQSGSRHWLPANAITRRLAHLEVVPIQYSVMSVLVQGSNVVNAQQQRYYPHPNETWPVQLLLYSARIRAQDALLRFPIGSGVSLDFPDGNRQSYVFGQDRSAEITSLARGIYYAQVQGVSGLTPSTPLALSRNQEINLTVVSQLDIFLVVSLFSIVVIGLALLGRWRLLTHRSRSAGHRRGKTAAGHIVSLFILTLGILWSSGCSTVNLSHVPGLGPGGPQPAAASPLPAAPVPVPRLAYYYIWYDQASWQSGKTDLPQLGAYTSDDPAVMRQHIQWAKQAGITGFIVSWKDTPTLDRRLERLVETAREEDFKLAIIYEGLDHSRSPLPVAQVAAGLDFFIAHYAADPVFKIFGKPLLIWSGSWKFSPEDIASVGAAWRGKILLLASEKSAAGYRRLAGSVDGDAYYWSSVNPETNSGYAEKLADLGKAVHSGGGLWIAPAAPGFDARGVGGTSVVDRRGGATLTSELNAALASAPDAVGLISWNEFSENSEIEPSQKYGDVALETLKGFAAAPVPAIGDFDSSAPGKVEGSPLAGSTWLALGFLGGLLAASLGWVFWRSSGRRHTIRTDALSSGHPPAS